MEIRLSAQPPFSLPAVITSHGWVRLAPFSTDARRKTLTYVDLLSTGRVVELTIRQAGDGVCISVEGALNSAAQSEVRKKVRWMLGLEQDFTDFYAVAADEPKLAHVTERAQGRLLRSPSLFEDTVKTILTTNTSWSGTIRMVEGLVSEFGTPLPADPARRAFPTPDQVARGDEEMLRAAAGLGYRAPYVLELARAVASGALDLESLKSTARRTDQVRQELLAIKGVGPYAAANLLMLLGRYDFVPVDSWARKMVSREWHGGRTVEEADVEAAFERWGAWKGLVYWFWNWTAEPLDWLLETDEENPGVRYFALRDILDVPASDDRVRRARRAVMRGGPVPVILEAQEPDGHWVKPGSGYSPKYRSTVWSVLVLAELGADPDDPRVRRGCQYLLSHARAPNGAFSAYQKPVASGALHCLNGNLVFAMQRLGFGEDPRVGEVRDWLARSIVGEDPIDYYGSGVCAPGFACGVNEKQPCAWGANKALRALLETPEQARTPLVERALELGAQFLLSRDPAVADYPYTERVSSTWFKLGFPLTYWSDVLETVSNLVRLGYGQHPRVASGLDWVRERRDDHGRWRLENSLRGKMWVDIERRGQPSKWITLRALKVLKAAGLYAPDS